MKNRDISLDFIRIFATALIVLFHFFIQYNFNEKATVVYANGTWGYLGTCIFFVLSGYLMWRKHSGELEIGAFYKKRWLSLFPAFYIAFIGAFIVKAYLSKKILFAGPAWTLIFSLLGIDSYMTWFGLQTYATVGEWFTGVIIVLYLLYPLVNLVFRKARWVGIGALTLLYAFMNITDTFPVMADVSIVNALFVFVLGMLIAEYGDKFREKKYLALPLLLLEIPLLFIELPISNVISAQILALCIFLVMYILFNFRVGEGAVKAITFLSGISYEVYLVHHFWLSLIDGTLLRFWPDMNKYLMLIIYLIVTLVLAWVLSKLTKFVTGLIKGKAK